MNKTILLVSMFLLMSMLSAAFFENTLSTYNTEENLSTLATVAQAGNNTYCTLNSSRSTDTQNVTLFYMDSSYNKKSTLVTLNGVNNVSTSGWNYAYVIANTTSTWEARNLTNISSDGNYSTILTKVPINKSIHEVKIVVTSNTEDLNISLNEVSIANITAGGATTTTVSDLDLVAGNNTINVTGNISNVTYIQIKSYYFNTTDTFTITNEGSAIWNLTSGEGGYCANSSGSSVYNCTCANYTNVYRLSGTSVAYTTDSTETSTSSTTNSDDGSTATLYDASFQNIYLENGTYFSTVWYYSNADLNISGGIVNSTGLVLPVGSDFTSKTSAITITSTSLPGTITLYPNNSTRTYNLTTNNTLGTDVYENDTAIADVANTSETGLLLTLRPNMKLSTINATLTVVGEIDNTSGVTVYIGSTSIGTLYANTSSFNVSQGVLNASWTNDSVNTTVTYRINSSTTDANITTVTLVYRGKTNSGWYVIPSANLKQVKRVQVQPDYATRCLNATITSNSTTNNITTSAYTKTGNTSGAITDMAYVYGVNTTAATGNISIMDAAGRILYTIYMGNTTMADNGASAMCLVNTGCTVKSLVYSSDALWKMSIKAWEKDGTLTTLFASYQAAGIGGMLGTTLPKIGAGERVLFYGTPYLDDTNTSINYEVG